jgi:hypothetical protein
MMRVSLPRQAVWEVDFSGRCPFLEVSLFLCYCGQGWSDECWNDSTKHGNDVCVQWLRSLSIDSGLSDAAALLQQNGQKLYQQGKFQAALDVFTEVNALHVHYISRDP